MKKLTSPVQLSIILAALMLMSACAEGPKKKTENNVKVIKENQTNIKDEEADDDDDVSFMLPSPIQIAAIFNRAGLEYQEGLANSPTNVNKYNTKTARYLNFGIYSADLAYAVLNDKQQAAIGHLNAVKTMSDAIGMSSVFGAGDLIRSFEKNIGNQDTILHVLIEVKRRTDTYLEENADKSKEAIFFSAAWIEGMFLGANSMGEEDILTPKLIEQMTILENIISAIETQDDPTLDIAFLIDGLKEINQYFNDIPDVHQYNIGNIELEDIELSQEALNYLKVQITDLRTQIING